MSPKIFTEHLNVLQQGLDFASLKNRAISSNIANIETPGYKAFKVVMDEKFASANASGKIKQTNPSHLGGSSASRLTVTDPDHIQTKNVTSGNFSLEKSDETTMRVDGNNVDLEQELADLSANAIYYTSISRFVAQNFTGLRKAISEGRR